MKRILMTAVFVLITALSFAQELNEYKYAVIPYEFSFLDRHDQYRVNTLVRYLFKNEGFEVYYDTEKFPADLANNRCKALYVGINNDSNIFITRMSFVLRDCNNEVILETAQAYSKIKAYERSYNQTLRRTFKEIEMMNYAYTPTTVVTEKATDDRPKVVENNKVVEVVAPPKKEVKPILETETEVETENATTEKTTSITGQTVKTKTATVLYAQPIENGFQLVDTSPKVVMVLLKTGVPNVYLVKGKDASVFKENGKWYLSNATNGGFEKTELNIKF